MKKTILFVTAFSVSVLFAQTRPAPVPVNMPIGTSSSSKSLPAVPLEIQQAAEIQNKTATLTETNEVKLDPYEFGQLYKKIADIKTNTNPRPKATSTWQMRVVDLSSGATSNLTGVLSLFNLNYNSQSSNTYSLLQMFKYADPQIVTMRMQNGQERQVIVQWGYGAVACVEIASKEHVASIGALELLSANVQLQKSNATVSIIPVGMDGPKLTTKFSSIMGNLDVKTISNIYTAFDRMQEFELDSTTTLTPQIISAKLVPKETLFLPDRIN